MSVKSISSPSGCHQWEISFDKNGKSHCKIIKKSHCTCDVKLKVKQGFVETDYCTVTCSGTKIETSLHSSPACTHRTLSRTNSPSERILSSVNRSKNDFNDINITPVVGTSKSVQFIVPSFSATEMKELDYLMDLNQNQVNQEQFETQLMPEDDATSPAENNEKQIRKLPPRKCKQQNRNVSKRK